MTTPPRILYCNCTYAQVVPKEVKEAVLKKLCESGLSFEAVADLCEMSARRDPALQRIAEGGAIKIAACYPRAVKWLFAAANAPLPLERSEVLNMRVQKVDELLSTLFSSELKPNLPAGKMTVADSPQSSVQTLGTDRAMNIVEQLLDLAQRQPFQPFTIHVAGGRMHRIDHPDFLGFSPRRRTVVVWTPADTAIFVNPALISEVEAHSGGKNGGSEQ